MSKDQNKSLSFFASKREVKSAHECTLRCCHNSILMLVLLNIFLDMT